MQPLNPFLRAFFSSKLPAQCTPSSNYILFIPTTEHLLTHKEHETQTDWDELVSSEEIIASHVVRIPGGAGPSHNGKSTPSLRDGKGKARQFPTLNGKTVVVKDNFIYSNNGFKSLNQAQLLQDAVYYPDAPNAQQWLIYYISKPLVGAPEPLYPEESLEASPQLRLKPEGAGNTKTRNIKAFNDLLNQFPIIARQMQLGLENLFQQFARDVEQSALNSTPPRSPAAPAFSRPKHRRSAGSFSSLTTLDGAQSLRSSIRSAGPQDNQLRQALETLVFSAVDFFQGIDKQQLSFLGASTDLSGPVVERMIERYVTEHFHASTLFPRICKSRNAEDEDLDLCIKQMSDVDLIQVGVDAGDGQGQRHELSLRLIKGVAAFKKMGVASSPQEMIDILVETEKCIVSDAIDQVTGKGQESDEASSPILTNADLLVSMLLLVVIRSGIRNLQARLFYMLEFLFIAENESGEVGYALSTYEAVLSYLGNNAGGLRRASQANRTLWRSVRKGDLRALKTLLKRDETLLSDDDRSVTSGEDSHARISGDADSDVATWVEKTPAANGHAHTRSSGSVLAVSSPNESSLGHIFPFQMPDHEQEAAPKAEKRVSMDLRSMSSSSAHSQFSQASTARSGMSMKVETSVECLCKTTDSSGSSILMMAVENGQSKVLQYLLHRSDLLPMSAVLADCKNDGTTLLGAALLGADLKVVGPLLDRIDEQIDDKATLSSYLSRQDTTGRSAAHYLFNAPQLITRLASVIPWQLKDNNDQTPLFALCRSYDHEDYSGMVESALTAATSSQNDGERLHLYLHTDARMNTLLHVANHPKIIRKLLWQCDSDPNVKNDKHFTPLMVASKFARLDSVRIMFSDERVDLQARDLRGLTAVELAKDDEVRNRIDDMVLLHGKPAEDGRISTIVRSYFVEDGSIRLILKSGAPNSNSTVTVTTCRRSLTDFENLARWLTLEHPASWLPSISNFRTPFQLPVRPSRTILYDTQLRLDAFFHTLLTHPTFSTHEMLWEFLLVPDISPEMLAQRAHLKATLRVENLRQDYTPVRLDAVPSIELFVAHASDQIRDVHSATAEVFRAITNITNIVTDLADAQNLTLGRLDALGFVPDSHRRAMTAHAAALAAPASPSSPLTPFHHHLHCTHSTTAALLTALTRPGNLIATLRASTDQLAKHQAASARSARWPSALGLLDDARRRLLDDSQKKAERVRGEVDTIGRELAYTRATVAGELAGWWERRAGKPRGMARRRSSQSTTAKARQLEGTVKAALRELARGMIVREKERLQRFRRAGRAIGVGLNHDGGKGKGHVA